MKTPQRLANLLGYPVAQDRYGYWFWFEEVPIFTSLSESVDWKDIPLLHQLPYGLVKYEGKWQESLRIPRSWKNNN